MFSIIVCSIRPHQAETLKLNITKTIGENVPFEFIAYDNRGTGKGICQVYNECAERARYENLCFIHEDVDFLTGNWGALIASRLSEPDCGVIGFAGSGMKAKAVTGWNSTKRCGRRMNYIQGNGNKKDYSRHKNPYNEDWARVITLDGLCMFCRKDVWSKVRFDDVLLRGFHCYDVDFAMSVHVAGYCNYVAMNVLVKHHSRGNCDRTWYEENLKFHKKWEASLPMYLVTPDDRRKRYLEYRSKLEWTRVFCKAGIYEACCLKHVILRVLMNPLNPRNYKYMIGYIKSRR